MVYLSNLINCCASRCRATDIAPQQLYAKYRPRFVYRRHFKWSKSKPRHELLQAKSGDGTAAKGKAMMNAICNGRIDCKSGSHSIGILASARFGTTLTS